MPIAPAPVQLGTWWQKDAEIDIIGLNPANGQILLGECKWQDGVNGPAVLNHLQETAVLVPWKPPNRQDYYVLFARTFKMKPAKSDQVKFIDELASLPVFVGSALLMTKYGVMDKFERGLAPITQKCVGSKVM